MDIWQLRYENSIQRYFKIDKAQRRVSILSMISAFGKSGTIKHLLVLYG
jgi:hypothetical protein